MDVQIKSEPVDYLNVDTSNTSEIFNQCNTIAESDEFEFETYILGLKGNKDYLSLIRTLATLESQRTRALKDVDRLLDLKKEAHSDPEGFVRKIQNGDELGYNGPQTIPEVPDVDWGKYKVSLPPEVFRRQTRNVGSRYSSDRLENADVVKIRGRVYDETKSVTFNKLWTIEEQLKLDELLVKYPPEDNETKRYSKIAQELGSRTVQQVTSRCQKYFRKLMKAGLPVPGRVPKSSKSEYFKNPKYATHKHSRNNAFLYPRSTFFPQSHLPVYMTDEENLPGTSTVNLSKIKTEPEDSDSDIESNSCASVQEETDHPNKPTLSDEMKNSTEYKKMQLLRRIKKDMEKWQGEAAAEHHGFMCNSCSEDPLRGTRWHCVTCDIPDADAAAAVDLCSECLIAQLEGQSYHPLHHHFIAFPKPQGLPEGWDEDYSYSYFAGSSNYNYLDPNFLPR